MPRINGERLLGDLRRIAQFGAYRTGVHRPTFSPQDVESRHWLVERMREAGLDARIDGVGNVFGRCPGAGPRLLMGSHSETQSYSGWLDGVMGVIYGLEVARALREDPDCDGMGVDVAAWADEESFFMNYLGSRSFIGTLTEEMLDASVSRIDGQPLREALQQAGFAGLAQQRLEEGRYLGYMEAHIEQGATLEQAGLRIGAVTGIVGVRLFRVTAEGIQNHAGTTPMPIRRDARAAVTRLCNAIDEGFAGLAAERTVWTIGRIDLEPNFPSVIPGRATMMVQMRDVDDAVLERMEQALRSMVAEADARGPCRLGIERVSFSKPAIMDAGFVAAVAEAAERHAPGLWTRMQSGAGHDAQILALRMPAAMLFVPSIGGISHHWTENTSDEDLVLGCQVFATAAAGIMRNAPAGGPGRREAGATP